LLLLAVYEDPAESFDMLLETEILSQKIVRRRASRPVKALQFFTGTILS